MILVYKEGVFVCIVLKDFYEGFEFYCLYLKEVDKCFDFIKMYKIYVNGKMNDFFEMDCIECL